MPKINLRNCWTCRLRHKKCDGTQPICQPCADLEISCYYNESPPEWLDNGSRQEAMAQQLKAEVKTKARQRRGRKALQRIEADLQDTSNPVDSQNSRILLLPGHSPGCKGRPQAPIRQCGTPASDLSLVSHRSNTLSSLSRATDSDIGLVIAYLDYIVPLLFPFYHPPILDGGRTWLLAGIIRNDAVRLQTSALTLYLLTIIPCRPESMTPPCQSYALEGAQSQRNLAVKHLQDDLRELSDREVNDDICQSTRVINSIAHILDLERVLAVGEEWQIHLRAALGILDGILREPARFEVSTWLMVLGQLSRVSNLTGYPTWNAEQAAFRFSVANLVVHDVIASISLERPPVLINHYRDLLHQDGGISDTNAVQLTDINGCQNWAMQLLGEIAALDAWRKEQRKSGAPYIATLSHRAAGIQARLLGGLARPTQPLKDYKHAITLENLTTNPSPSCSLVTRLWIHASQIYLYVILHGWQPFKSEIQDAVSDSMTILEELSSSIMHLRTQAWPICVVGCLATEPQKIIIRDLYNKLGPLANFGSIDNMMRILENVWSSRALHDTDQWDISHCLNMLGHKVLLV